MASKKKLPRLFTEFGDLTEEGKKAAADYRKAARRLAKKYVGTVDHCDLKLLAQSVAALELQILIAIDLYKKREQANG